MKNPDSSQEHALSQIGPDESEVLLRNRDVQALSRAFRRMADVQESLMTHLGEIEEQRSKRWLLPAIALGSLVLGVGLTIAGLAWYQNSQQIAPIEVNMDPQQPPVINYQPPDITVQAPAITLQAPQGGLDAAAMQAVLDRLDSMNSVQVADRRLIADLSGKLVDSEMAALDIYKEMQRMEFERQNQPMGQPEAASMRSNPVNSGVDPVSAGAEPGSENGPERYGYPVDVWLGVLNGLMAADGHPDYRFQQATRVPDKATLREVIFFQWGKDGLLDTIVRADLVQFHLLQSNFSLEMHFTNGTRTRNGVKTALPGGGLHILLPDVQVSPWVEHFPELAEPGRGMSAEEIAQAAAALVEAVESTAELPPIGTALPTAPAVPDLETVRLAVDQLISKQQSFGFYRLNKLTSMTADSLHGVQISWYDSKGALFKYIEADQMKIIQRGEDWVELQFEQGSFIKVDRKTPFHNGKYRIHLSGQDAAAWRATGAPIQVIGTL
jgi:hypothetical protein